MGVMDRLEKQLEHKVEQRMGPAVKAMNSLEKKIDKLIKAIEQNTKALKQRR